MTAVMPAPAVHAQEWAVWLAAVTAGLTAAGWLFARLRRAWRRTRASWAAWAVRFDALDTLVSHELQPNTGSSMKDSLKRVEAAQAQHLAEASQAARVITSRLDALEDITGTFAESQAHLWPAIEAVAQATPPTEGKFDADI